MNKREKTALSMVVEYMIMNEQTHYLESPVKNHIYHDVLVLDRFIKKDKRVKIKGE